MYHRFKIQRWINSNIKMKNTHKLRERVDLAIIEIKKGDYKLPIDTIE